MTIFYAHAFHWALRARRGDSIPAAGPFRTYGQATQCASARDERAYWTGHVKNTFSVMVKTGVRDIVPHVTPAVANAIAELVHTWRQARAQVAQALGGLFAQLIARPDVASLQQYAGAVPNCHSGGGLWLSRGGPDGFTNHWIDVVMPSLFDAGDAGAVPPQNWSPLQPAAPPAYVFHNGQRHTVVVCESRIGQLTLNRRMLAGNAEAVATALPIAALVTYVAGPATPQTVNLPNP